MDSSVLVTVPSGAWVTVFSFVLTVPSLLVVLVFSLETWRSHPTSKNDDAKALMATLITMIRFFMAATYTMRPMMSIGGFPPVSPEMELHIFSPHADCFISAPT